MSLERYFARHERRFTKTRIVVIIAKYDSVNLSGRIGRANIMYCVSPLRISFGGGNTDVEPYRSNRGGVSFGVAINKYTFARHSSNGRTDTSDLVDAIKKRFLCNDNIVVDSDAPSYSGLGASGAMAVSVIGLITSGKMPLKDIARIAFNVERDDLCVAGGFQDQVWASFGGMQYIEFGDDRFDVLPMARTPFIDLIQDRMLLVNVGPREDGIQIHEDEKRRTEDNFPILDSIKEIANEERRAIRAEDFNTFCSLLHDSWMYKKMLSPLVSRNDIDEFYDNARNNGAAAGKLSGAGNGGFMMFIANDISQLKTFVRDSGYEPEPVKFEWSGMKVVG